MTPDPETTPDLENPPDDEPEGPENWEVEALYRLDAALAAGRGLIPDGTERSPLSEVHDCQRLLEAIWPRAASEALPPDGRPATERIGKYQVIRELGRGGFGGVFLAEDPDLMRRVAVKVPRPEFLVSPGVRRRFLAEAQAAGRFDHPGIVPVHAIGNAGPVSYIVSAYCEGPTLAAWLRDRPGPVPPRVAARLVSAVARAIHHAHSRGILHRDLKPGNILLQPVATSVPPREGDAFPFQPRVCDFGLAHVLEAEAQDTMSGLPVGSPGYMAPEQAEGRNRDLGPPTDVYALGTILFEVLTGRPPFRGETPLETLRLVSETLPVPPHALRPGLPTALSFVCLKCLAKQPDRRYDSAEALADDLDRFLEGRPVLARPNRDWFRGKGRPAHLAVVALTSVCLVGTLTLREVAFPKRDVPAAPPSHELLAARHRSGTFIANTHDALDAGNIPLAWKTLREGERLGDADRHGGFARRYLLKRFQPATTRLTRPGPASGVLDLVFSPDGRTLATGDSRGRVDVWDLATGHPPRRLNLFTKEVVHLALSGDGRVIAAAGGPPNVVKFVEVATGRELGRSDALSAQPLLVEFLAPSGPLVTAWTSGRAGTCEVKLWDVPDDGGTHAPSRKISGGQLTRWNDKGRPETDGDDRPVDHPDETAARFTYLADRTILAFRPDPGEARLFDMISGRELCRAGRRSGTAAVLCGPDTPLALAALEGLGHQGRVALGMPKPKHARNVGPVQTAAFSADGLTLATQIRGQPFALYEPVSGRAQAVMDPMGSCRVVVARFSPDGRSLVFAGADGSVVLWSPEAQSLAGHTPFEVWSLAFSPDGRTLASAGDDHDVRLWDLAGGRLVARLRGHTSLVTAVAYTPDGRTVVSTGFDGKVRLWNAGDGRALAVLTGHTDRVRVLAVSPDGRTLVTAGNDQTARIWDLARRSLRAAVALGDIHQAQALAFSPDGSIVAVGSGGNLVTLLDHDLAAVRSRITTRYPPTALAYSPDGLTLAQADVEGRVDLWDPAEGRIRSALNAHPGGVLGLAFSPDGRSLASVGRDKAVRVWDPLTGQVLLHLKGHEGQTHALAFSPGGSCLATGSHDGAIRLWWADPRPPDRTASP